MVGQLDNSSVVWMGAQSVGRMVVMMAAPMVVVKVASLGRLKDFQTAAYSGLQMVGYLVSSSVMQTAVRLVDGMAMSSG